MSEQCCAVTLLRSTEVASDTWRPGRSTRSPRRPRPSRRYCSARQPCDRRRSAVPGASARSCRDVRICHADNTRTPGRRCFRHVPFLPTSEAHRKERPSWHGWVKGGGSAPVRLHGEHIDVGDDLSGGPVDRSCRSPSGGRRHTARSANGHRDRWRNGVLLLRCSDCVRSLAG